MGWANYLSQFGYYPTIVTRNWDILIESPEDVLISCGDEVIHKKEDRFEVYYLPYRASKRDQIFSHNKNNKFIQKSSKFFTLKDQILENYSNSAIPFSNLYDFSLDLILQDRGYQCLLISGNPFIQFKFGYLLNQKTGIKWIADYRDDWNTSELTGRLNGLKRIISRLHSKSEKKWVKSSECIISISKRYSEKISSFVHKKGYVILNGFDGVNEDELITTEEGKFTITYNGSLYSTQPIEILLRAFIKVIQNQEVKIDICINFPGLGFDQVQKKRVEQEIIGFEMFFNITDRIPKSEVINIQKRSDLLLMVTHEGIKGIPSSKMYEYIGLKKPILLYPNDYDIVEETLNHTGMGIICNNIDEIYSKLLKLVLAKQEGRNSELILDNEKIEFYSRKNQTAELAQLLDRLI